MTVKWKFQINKREREREREREKEHFKERSEYLEYLE